MRNEGLPIGDVPKPIGDMPSPGEIAKLPGGGSLGRGAEQSKPGIAGGASEGKYGFGFAAAGRAGDKPSEKPLMQASTGGDTPQPQKEPGTPPDQGSSEERTAVPKKGDVFVADSSGQPTEPQQIQESRERQETPIETGRVDPAEGEKISDPVISPREELDRIDPDEALGSGERQKLLVARDHVARTVEQEVTVQDLVDTVAGAVGLEEPDAEAQIKMLRGFSMLTGKQQVVLWYRMQGGKLFREIGELTGTTTHASMAEMNARAVLKLKQAMQEPEVPGRTEQNLRRILAHMTPRVDPAARQETFGETLCRIDPHEQLPVSQKMRLLKAQWQLGSQGEEVTVRDLIATGMTAIKTNIAEEGDELRVLRGIAALTPQQLQVFWSRFHENRNSTQISEELNMPPKETARVVGNVRSTLRQPFVLEQRASQVAAEINDHEARLANLRNIYGAYMGVEKGYHILQQINDMVNSDHYKKLLKIRDRIKRQIEEFQH